jgi:hypothetical protein
MWATRCHTCGITLLTLDEGLDTGMFAMCPVRVFHGTFKAIWWQCRALLGVFVTREHVRHNKSGITHRDRAKINHSRELLHCPTRVAGGSQS